MEWQLRGLPIELWSYRSLKMSVLRGLYKQQTRTLIDLHNNKKSKMNVQEAEGSCPSEKSRDPKLEPH